jgi:molecular chaperone DnaK (HSP70)
MALAACTQSSRPPTLDDGLSIEQPGGAATKLVPPAYQLPTSATESFVTSKDEETRLFVHVLRGVGKKSSELKSDSWWVIDGLTSAAAGLVRAQVTFEVDVKQQVTVSAREDDRKLKVSKVDPKSTAKLSAAALLEPDDDDDGVDEE